VCSKDTLSSHLVTLAKACPRDNGGGGLILKSNLEIDEVMDFPLTDAMMNFFVNKTMVNIQFLNTLRGFLVVIARLLQRNFVSP